MVLAGGFGGGLTCEVSEVQYTMCGVRCTKVIRALLLQEFRTPYMSRIIFSIIDF